MAKGQGYFDGPDGEQSDIKLALEIKAQSSKEIAVFVREDRPFTSDPKTKRREAMIVVSRQDYEIMVAAIAKEIELFDKIEAKRR